MKDTFDRIIKGGLAVCPRRLSENEKFFPRSRKAKIITAGIH